MARFERLVKTGVESAADAGKFVLAVALPLAWDWRATDALDYFRRVPPENLDDLALEWKAHAALWAGEWTQASQAIAAMSGPQRAMARWRYWEARTAEQTGADARAKELYASTLADDNFYSVMSAARLGRSLSPNPLQLPEDRESLRKLEETPAFIRARELRLAGMNSQADAEWTYGMQSAPQATRPQAIRLAASWGWYNQAVATATQHRVFNDYALLYPTPYDKEVREGARLAKLEPELVYSVVRQESLYRRDAVSSAGARGLMQLMPETARRTARKFGLATPTAATLFDPATNIRIGAAHVRELVDRFDGQRALALAAYNAGPGAAQRWLPDRPIDLDIWIENIPYNETRAYVQRILWHEQVFTWLRTGKAHEPDRKTWLGKIEPRS